MTAATLSREVRWIERLKQEAAARAVEFVEPGIVVGLGEGSTAALAAVGRTEEARRNLDALIALEKDVGLLSDEYDPAAKRSLGNFPQAFPHIGLLSSIL